MSNPDQPIESASPSPDILAEVMPDLFPNLISEAPVDQPESEELLATVPEHLADAQPDAQTYLVQVEDTTAAIPEDDSELAPSDAETICLDRQSQRLVNLEQQVFQQSQRLVNLEQQVPTLQQQVQILSERVATVLNQFSACPESSSPAPSSPEPSDPPINLQPLIEAIEAACETDEQPYRDDQQNLAQYWTQLQHYAAWSRELRQGMIAVIGNAVELMMTCQQAKSELPEFVQEQLQERHSGLEVIGRMVSRLEESVAKLPEAAVPPEPLPTLDQHMLIQLSQEFSDIETFQQEIERKLKEVSNLRYQQVYDLRSAVEDRRKQIINFITAKVLPILDGLANGEGHTNRLLDQILQSNSDQETTLRQWFQFYPDLQAQILQVLQPHVQPMTVHRGDAADYIRHMPLSAEPDSELENEFVKEVIQQGYEYQAESNLAWEVLRPAQVIMVKNN